MTIETGPAPSGVKSPGAMHAGGPKGKTGSTDKSTADAPTGFMAILATMEAPAATDPVADSEPPAVPSDATATGLVAMSGASFWTGFNQLPATPIAVDTDSATAMTGVDNALSGPALTDAGVNPAPIAPGADVALAVLMAPAAMLAQSLQPAATPAERVSAAEDVKASNSIVGVSAEAKPLRTTAAPTSAPVPHDMAGDVAPEASRKLVGKQSDSSAKQGQPDLTQINAVKSNAQPDAKAQDFMQRVSTSQVAPVAMELAVASSLGLSQREGHASERSIFKPSGTETVYGQPQPVTELAANAPVSGPSEAASPTETFVAEQISYWISNDVQNAEMKLDGIGDAPVGVSISMHGNEAHVIFRTDELQAREALENASLHLKDLLQREGLVLGGVSVGTSGAGDSGGQEPRQRQGAKVATVASAAVGVSNRRPVQSGAAGRALDLFV